MNSKNTHYSVVINNDNTFRIDTDNVSQDEAIARCFEIMGESHGGETYVVIDATAKEIEGEDTTEIAFTAYDIHGNPMQVNQQKGEIHNEFNVCHTRQINPSHV